MALFNFGKKKDEEKKEPACTCGCSCGANEPTAEENCHCSGEKSGISNIKVLGSGCKNCHTLLENTKAAVATLGLDIEVEYITDMEKVMTYGIMSMPALVVNDKVVSMGKVLKAADVEKLLHKLGV